MTNWKFCEAGDILAMTRIADGYAKYDGIIQRLLPLVATQIQNFCRRTLVEGTFTEYYPTPSRGEHSTERVPYKIWLNELNMSADNPPTVKLDYYFPLDWSTIPAYDTKFYRVDYVNSKIIFLGFLAEHSESIQVTYQAGYPVDSEDPNLIDVPDAIVQAAALQGAFLLNMIINKDMGQTVKNAQGTHKTLALDKASREGLIPEAQGLLLPYRRQLVSKVY